MNSFEKPLLLLSIVFFFGAIAILFYLVSPLYSGVNGFLEKRTEYKARSAELENLKVYHASIVSAYKELETVKWNQIKEKINVNFTSNDPMFLPKMYSFFQDRVVANGMSLESVIGSANWDLKKNSNAQSPGESSDRVKRNQFNLSLLGSYESFKNLLANLENQALVTSVTELSFAVQPSVSSIKKTALGGMQFSLKLTVPSY